MHGITYPYSNIVAGLAMLVIFVFPSTYLCWAEIFKVSLHVYLLFDKSESEAFITQYYYIAHKILRVL